MTRVRRLITTVAFVSAVTIAAAGCHKKAPAAAPAPPPTPPQTAPVTPPPPPPPPAPPPPATQPPLSEEDIFARKSLEQLNAEHPLDDVFFDLDESTIRNDGRSALQKDADWM